MIRKEALQNVLVEGRRLSSDQYHKHCRGNHVKTFYFFCLRLSSAPSNTALSSTELNEFILDELRRRKVDGVTDQFNPQGWFGQAWTDWKDPSKNEKHFREEYYDVLIRTGDDPYFYQINPEYFGMVKEIFQDFEAGPKPPGAGQ
jgi:hypothetical protein